jgi:hypothetical protein
MLMSDQPPVTPPAGSDPNDPFAPFESKPKGMPPEGYGPNSFPPYTQPEKKGPNRLLYILLGLILGVFCICGTCVVGSGVLFSQVASNPTFQAIVGTGFARIQAPDTLPASAQSKGTIKANQPVTDTLDAMSDDAYKYQGKSGEQITVTVQSISRSLVPYIGIYDSSGKVQAKSIASSADRSQSVTYTFPNNATYTILVGPFSTTSGDYTLTVTSSSSQ